MKVYREELVEQSQVLRRCMSRHGGQAGVMCTDVCLHVRLQPLVQPCLPPPASWFPARFRGLLFDSDGSWEPGDIRGCNNINALHQVFTSGTRLGIINTYTLFASSAGANHHGAPWMLPSPFLCPSFLPVLQATVWKESQGSWQEWCRQHWAAHHLFTFGICIMRRGTNGSPDWLKTGWHAFGFNGHAEETSNPSWHIS